MLGGGGTGPGGGWVEEAARGLADPQMDCGRKSCPLCHSAAVESNLEGLGFAAGK